MVIAFDQFWRNDGNTGTAPMQTPESRISDCLISVQMVVHPAGRTETPPVRTPFVAMHVGGAVHVDCQRGGQQYSGVAIHGDIDVVPAFTGCVWEPQETHTTLALTLDPELLNSIVEGLGKSTADLELRSCFQMRDLQVERIGWALKSEMEGGYPSGPVFRDSLGKAMAAYLVGRYSNLASASGPSCGGMRRHKLKRVLCFIEDGLMRDLSVREIAGVAGISVSHFKMTFRESVGIPVHQYIIQRRLEKATFLLRKGTLPISQIAEETGFAHQSHLAHQMRRFLGCSPNTLRNLEE